MESEDKKLVHSYMIRTFPDGTKEWFRDGKRHREDGPAVVRADGTKLWYLNGKKVTEAERKTLLRTRKEADFAPSDEQWTRKKLDAFLEENPIKTGKSGIRYKVDRREFDDSKRPDGDFGAVIKLRIYPNSSCVTANVLDLAQKAVARGGLLSAYQELVEGYSQTGLKITFFYSKGDSD